MLPGFTGRKHSEKSKRQTSMSLRGRKQSPEHIARKAAALVGHVISDETREKIRAKALGRPHVHKEGRSCGYCRPTPYAYTRLSSELADILIDAGYDLVPEVRFGRYWIDLYEPIRHLAFEADGGYWHGLPGRKEYDENRDAWLLEQYGLPVVRISEADIRQFKGG